MKKTISYEEFICLQKVIEEKSGITIDADKSYLIENRLSSVLESYAFKNFQELFDRIINKNEPELLKKVIDAISINETFWFRDISHWKTLEALVLPIFIDEIMRGKRDKIRIWSAACSTGQEAYSTAICIDKFLIKNKSMGINLSNFEILASDISFSALEIAQNCLYDEVSMSRGLPEEDRNTYFKRKGKLWSINDKIKQSVNFKQINLCQNFWFTEKFDIVFLKNVLIYFSKDTRNHVLNRIGEYSSKTSFLFIGSSEILHTDNEFFKINDYEGTIYYSKKED